VRVETKSPPKKKAKLENKDTSLSCASVKVESSNKPGKEQKKAKKTSQDPATSKNSTKASKVQNHCSAKVLETNKEKVMDKDSQKHKKIKGKHPNASLQKKVKTPKSNLGVPSMSQAQRGAVGNRSLLRFDKRQYPVNHYIKEAKKLKHKADAEVSLHYFNCTTQQCLWLPYYSHILLCLCSQISLVKLSPTWKQPCSLLRAALPWRMIPRFQCLPIRCLQRQWSFSSKTSYLCNTFFRGFGVYYTWRKTLSQSADSQYFSLGHEIFLQM
ncbi:hypothetical protein XENOCAPTIV_009659, partial [Xenoophorus captivus]